MTDKTCDVVRILIASYFAVWGAVCVKTLIPLIASAIDRIDPYGTTLPLTVGLAFLIIVFSFLAYGLFRSRRWVVRLHLVVLIFWLILTSPVTVSGMSYLWYQRNARGVITVAVLLVIPIAIQLFLSLGLKKRLVPGPPLCGIQKVGFGVAVLFSSIVLIAVGGLTLFTGMSIFSGREPQVLDHIENERFIVTAEYYPSIWITDAPIVSVSCLAHMKSGLGLSNVWSSGHVLIPDSLSVYFHGDDSIGVVRYRAGYRYGESGSPRIFDTILVDLTNPEPNVALVEDQTGYRWKYELNFAGCEEIEVVENKRYRVMFRRYPRSDNGDGGGSRLLYVDKTSWLEKEEILAESHHGDSVEIEFVDEFTVLVSLYKHDSFWKPMMQYGEVVTKEYCLDQSSDYQHP